MKSFFVTNIKIGDELENEPFLIQDSILRETKDGRPYLLGSLRDNTGQLSFVYWDIPSYTESWVATGSAVLVTGRAVRYKDALQINVTDMNQNQEPVLADLLPASRRPRAEMLAELNTHIRSLGQPWQQLVTKLLLEEKFLALFADAPAARNMHHAYIGGLMEHTLSMAKIANQLASHYPFVNRDLLLAGTLLHDMGKTIEYDISKSFSFSEDGRLVGHITRAVVMVEKAAIELDDFPEEDLRHLVHLIASHHGTQEWGSPIVPKTLEAILLHQIDLLDSRVQGFFDHLSNDNGEGDWTVKSSYMFNTELRRPDGFDWQSS
ncbi:3'-5' exoribonuclease YhaM family protein [Candidatus Leptofilum sp.]|uniref:3'-5' exoribonuclease YhaM family protein n=1 Tax=Candidatus Leptofilum sp. TaxID=3241576 RepID=UPI003B5B33AF